jgi:hypothetical protein
MTYDDADDKARALWGTFAYEHGGTARASPYSTSVGILINRRDFLVIGKGNTWEEAFEDAEKHPERISEENYAKWLEEVSRLRKIAKS